MVMDRRRRAAGREVAEIVLNRAEALEEADRALLERVVGQGVRPVELAPLMGLTPRSIQRRVRGLMERLLDEEVAAVIAARKHWGERLGKVATRIWVQRKTMVETARELGVPVMQVREDMQAIRALIRAREELRTEKVA